MSEWSVDWKLSEQWSGSRYVENNRRDGQRFDSVRLSAFVVQHGSVYGGWSTTLPTLEVWMVRDRGYGTMQLVHDWLKADHKEAFIEALREDGFEKIVAGDIEAGYEIFVRYAS